MADVPDPIIKLSVPGTGTFDLCTVANAGDTCFQTLFDGEPDTTIDANGFANFAVKNVDANTPALTVIAINFFFQTDNLFQPFSAFADDFHIVGLTRHFNEGCLLPGSEGCILPNPAGTLEVDFSGMEKPGTPGSFSLGAISCGDFDVTCPTAQGFRTGSSIDLQVTYDIFPDPDPCCDGIQPGQEAQLTITSDTVPEPSTFVLLFGAAGILAIRRKFRRA